MNLFAMREFATMQPRRIHHALPIPGDTYYTTPAPCTGAGHKVYEETRVSSDCLIGPQAKHGLCKETWCKCQCHDDYEMLYGMM